MDISEFKRILISFADEPSNVDIRPGHVIAQLRDDLIDVSVKYDLESDMQLTVLENGQKYSPRSWLINRVARLPQLAERIIASTNTTPEAAERAPFVVPEGRLTPDISAADSITSEIIVNDAVVAITDKASVPLPGATSVLYVTSDAGEGKTTVINRAARQQAERFKRREVASLIVPIPLGGKTFQTFDDAVIAALVNKLRFNYLYYEAFINLVRMGAIVPAFDGYEEMLVEGAKGEAISALGNLVQNLDSSGTLIVASRKAFFEYVSFRTQARLLDAIGDRSASFSRLAIGRWSKEKFVQYGIKRKCEASEEVFETIANRLSPDHPLLTRAVLVQRLFDVLGRDFNQEKLIGMLGKDPHDYFFTFVDAIIKREANEKWLSRAVGDVKTPLLEVRDHHVLLSTIAQEMWQTSVNSLRLDVVDTIVDIFADGKNLNALVVRQIKERIKQHSLLVADPARGQALAFDHEDFQNFYLGEAIGNLLNRLSIADLRAVLSISVLPVATAEHAVQHLSRAGGDLSAVLQVVLGINDSETGFTFCKENCGRLAVWLAEAIPGPVTLRLSSLYLPPGSLLGRGLSGVTFESCHFQPTGLSVSTALGLTFVDCEFERIEVAAGISLKGFVFTNCRVDALLFVESDAYIYDPVQVRDRLTALGAKSVIGIVTDSASTDFVVDERFKLLERFLKIFLRSTHIDEAFIRLRVGKANMAFFMGEVIPVLLANGALEEIPWKGQGVQRRFKLGHPMSEINVALEGARGSFDRFVRNIGRI